MKRPFPGGAAIGIALFVLLLAIAFLTFGLAGGQIASNATAAAHANATQTFTAGLDATRTALAGPISCGEVTVSPGATPAASAMDSASCFQFAFESCKPASIVLHNADTGTTRTFTTGKQGTRCYIVMTTQISDTSKGTPPAPVQCKGEAFQSDGFHISGCDGQVDIVIPEAAQ